MNPQGSSEKNPQMTPMNTDGEKASAPEYLRKSVTSADEKPRVDYPQMTQMDADDEEGR